MKTKKSICSQNEYKMSYCAARMHYYWLKYACYVCVFNSYVLFHVFIVELDYVVSRIQKEWMNACENRPFVFKFGGVGGGGLEVFFAVDP